MKRKKHLLKASAIICFLAIAAVGFAYNAYGQAPGKLTASPEHFDCGTLDEGTPAVMSVELKNIGDTDVNIKNVRTN